MCRESLRFVRPSPPQCMRTLSNPRPVDTLWCLGALRASERRPPAHSCGCPRALGASSFPSLGTVVYAPVSTSPVVHVHTRDGPLHGSCRPSLVRWSYEPEFQRHFAAMGTSSATVRLFIICPRHPFGYF